MDAPTDTARVPLIQMDDVAAGAMHNLNHVVAEHVRWRVFAGDYWVVAGLQGSGTSDFLMMVGGVVAPLQGSYQLFGEQMPIFDEARLHKRLRLGLVFDGGQLFNHLTVRENVGLPLRYHHNLSKAQAEPEVQRLLEIMELGPWADTTPGAMETHWQKRVGLARALMLQPEILLVDNPLAGLDPRHMQWWLDFLDELAHGQGRAEGHPVTLVVTTADLRPWKGRARQFATLREKHLRVLDDWNQAQTASEELLQELLPRLPSG